MRACCRPSADEQVADRVPGEDGGPLGRPQALGVEGVGDLRGRAPGGEQFFGALAEPGEVAQLGQGRDRAGDAARRCGGRRPR